jgi:hypothetical protein
MTKINQIKKSAMKKVSYFMLLVLFSFSSCSPKSEIEACYVYLKKHGRSPNEYVISKFEHYDYVFLGEPHWNKHDADFVASLVPDLYKNGIKNIAVEFYAHANQAIVDSLLTAKEWNEQLLYHHLSRSYAVWWGYVEYLNLFKNVWRFNQTLKENQPEFRVVLLQYELDFCKKGIERFGGIDPDLFMANVLEKEVISKNEKVLVHLGMHHAFSTYRQPIYDFKEGKFIRFNPDERTGNIIYDKYPEKTFTISLHYPWISDKGFETRVKPVNGVIDSVMARLDNRPMGFDAKNTVMGKLKADKTYYAFGYDDFRLELFCDGYIFLTPFSEVQAVSVEMNFYDEYNLNKFKHFNRCYFPEEQLQAFTKESIVEIITKKIEDVIGDFAK